MAEVAGGTLNSSAANLRTAVNGVFSGTLNLKTNNTDISTINKQEFVLSKYIYKTTMTQYTNGAAYIKIHEC